MKNMTKSGLLTFCRTEIFQTFFFSMNFKYNKHYLNFSDFFGMDRHVPLILQNYLSVGLDIFHGLLIWWGGAN